MSERSLPTFSHPLNKLPRASIKEILQNIMKETANRQIRYIFDPEPGLLTGRHRGALEAKGELLVFVDDDIEATSGWLPAILETFKSPRVELVGGGTCRSLLFSRLNG